MKVKASIVNCPLEATGLKIQQLAIPAQLPLNTTAPCTVQHNSARGSQAGAMAPRIYGHGSLHSIGDPAAPSSTPLGLHSRFSGYSTMTNSVAEICHADHVVHYRDLTAKLTRRLLHHVKSSNMHNEDVKDHRNIFQNHQNVNG